MSIGEAPGTFESEIRREAAALSQKGPRHGVAEVIREFRGKGGIQDARHLEMLVKALCAVNFTWVHEFRARAEGRKRCPSFLRSLLRTWLSTLDQTETRYTRVTPKDVLRRAREPRSREELAIDNKYELGLGPGARQLLAKLADVAKKPAPVDLIVRFRCEHICVHGLAILEVWCERRAANVRLLAESPRVERYLEATGFRQVVEDCVTID